MPDEEIVNNLKTVLNDEMNDKVGIVRNDRDLSTVLKLIAANMTQATVMVANHQPTPGLYETMNLTQVATLITKSALHRKESRGLHYTNDYPEKLESERRDTVLSLNKGYKQ